MSGFRTKLEVQRELGTPRTIDGLTITSESKALALRWPRGVWVWNRPVAVRIERADGTLERLPILDVTRIGQWALGGLAALFAVVSVVITIKNQAKDNANRRFEHE